MTHRAYERIDQKNPTQGIGNMKGENRFCMPIEHGKDSSLRNIPYLERGGKESGRCIARETNHAFIHPRIEVS